MYIKAKYLKNDIPAGKAYTFETDVPVKIGDKISVGKAQAVVEVVNVPEELQRKKRIRTDTEKD